MRNTALVLILALQSAMCASNGAVNYVPWKDPLSKDELDALIEFCENAVAIGNALRSCQMEMAGGFVTNGATVDLRVSCGNAALSEIR